MSNELKYLSSQVVNGKITRRYFMGRAAALGIATPIAVNLLNQAAYAEGPKKGGTLKIGVDGAAATDTLDPALATISIHITNLMALGDRLLYVTKDGDLGMLAAEDFSPSKDAKTWTFKIRKGIEFHNGKTLTPQDVLETYQRHSDEESKSGALGITGEIESMRATKDEFIVTLKEANTDFPYLTTDYHLQIQPNGGKDNPTDGIMSGPYRLKEEEPGVRYLFEKNPNYWDNSRGHVEFVEVFGINDATARIAALQAGQVDMINRLDPKVVDRVKNIPGVTIQNVAGKGHYVFIMHCNTSPFDNNDLRTALKYAVDREEMVDKILRGYGTIGNDMPVNNTHPFFSNDIEQRQYDPDQAQFYFKKSGYDGEILLRTAEVAFPGAIEAAQLFQEQAKKAGINITVKREPDDGYWNEVWNTQPFCTSYWGGRPTQDQMYTTAYLSTADWNDTKFFRPDFDTIIKQAKSELDKNKKTQLYKQAGLMVRNEGGLICPMFNDFIDASGKRVEGYVSSPVFELMGQMAPHFVWLNS